MDINSTFIENRAIKIAILPIGDISSDSFREYSSLIKTLGIIELSGITRDAKESRVLEKINWIDGHMLMNFVTPTTTVASEWEDIMIHKRIFGVIGVVDCKRSRDLVETKKLFEEAVGPYRSAVASVCYAFDPLDEQQDLERGKFVMIPNAGDKKHLLFYLSTLLFDFSYQLLRHFEKMVAETDIASSQSYISTPLESVISWDEVSRAKKRKQGRALKCKGDYCLLAGSPLDAIKFYDQSIELSKSNNDYEWIAASYEGQISAILSKRNQEFHSQNQNISPTSAGPNQQLLSTAESQSYEDQQILNMATEALQFYKKKQAMTFEIELTMKLANYHISMERKIEASELLTAAYDLCFGMTIPEKITAICSIALAYYSMGFKRKFAFFIREAAFIYPKKPESWDKINNLLQISTRFFQLEELFPPQISSFLDEKNKTYNYSMSTVTNQAVTVKKQSSRSHGAGSKPSSKVATGVTSSGRGSAWQTRMPPLATERKKEGWYIIQRFLLYNLISVASHLLDSLSICKYIIYLLRTQHQLLPVSKQHDFQSDLAHHSKTISTSINTNVHMNILGFPILVKLTPLPLSDHLVPHSRQIENNQQKDKFFIYSPYEREKVQKKQMLWVEGECSLLLTLSNPFAFDVLVQSVSLSTAGIPFECYPMSFKVLSCTEKMDIIITGRALKPGPLIIKGVFIRSYNLLSEHPINPQGEAISIKEYEEYIKRDAYKVELDAPVVFDDDKCVNKITVVPKLPLLKVSVPSFGSTLSLFTGEYQSFPFIFENIGNEPIETIQLVLTELDKSVKKSIPKHYTFEDEDELAAFQWDESIVRSALPLMPGKSFSLPLKTYGRPYTPGNQLTITYNRQGDEHLYQRKILVPLQMDLHPGPEITNFNIIYTSLNSLKQLESFVIYKILNNQQLQKLSSPVHKHHNNHKNSNHQHDIRNDYCLLVFEIRNNSSTHSFTMTYNNLLPQHDIAFDNTTFKLPPNSIINIHVPMKRDPFPDTLPPIRQAKGQYIKPKKKLTEHEEYLNRLIQYYKDMFIRNIKLTWVSSDHTYGNLILNGITLTPKMIYKLNIDPITIEFKDRNLFKTCEVGEFQTFDIVVTNTSNSTITGLILHIQPALEKDVDDVNASLHNKIGYVGSLTIPIKELLSHHTYQHSLQVVFFERDIYKFVISCELFKTKQALPSLNTLKVQVI